LAAGDGGEMMTEAGLDDVNLTWVNQMSWAAVGTRPTSVRTWLMC
jgi:hypothetical protein